MHPTTHIQVIQVIQIIVWSLYIATSLWVWADARAIGVRKGQIRGLGNLTPVGWFISSLLLWPFAPIFYLIKRPTYKRINGHRPTNLNTWSAQPRPDGVKLGGDATPSPSAPFPNAFDKPTAPSPSAPTWAPQSASLTTGMVPVQALVWGVVLLVLGLALAGWGGYATYQDGQTVVQATVQLHDLDRINDQNFDQFKQTLKQSDNLGEQFLGALMSPEMLQVVRDRVRSERNAAANRLFTHLPLLLLGPYLVFTGNALLGRKRTSG